MTFKTKSFIVLSIFWAKSFFEMGQIILRLIKNAYNIPKKF